MTPQWLRNDCPKNLKLLKYEHIIYHFKARDLKIPLIGVVGAILIGGAILIICVSNFRNRRD